MDDQRRLLPVKVFDWLELLQLIRQGWVVNVQFATNIAARTEPEVYYNLVTQPNVTYVWVNGSARNAFQAKELLATETRRIALQVFCQEHGRIVYH